MDTLLVVNGIALAPYSARGLTQTLEPIEQTKQTRRTINGGLRDNSAPQFQKYRSTISCTDINGPTFDKTWPGKSLVIDCVPELSYLSSGGMPGRPVVMGSQHNEGMVTFYRPRLNMMITTWSLSEDEYGNQLGWNMDLEEI